MRTREGARAVVTQRSGPGENAGHDLKPKGPANTAEPFAVRIAKRLDEPLQLTPHPSKIRTQPFTRCR